MLLLHVLSETEIHPRDPGNVNKIIMLKFGITCYLSSNQMNGMVLLVGGILSVISTLLSTWERSEVAFEAIYILQFLPVAR